MADCSIRRRDESWIEVVLPTPTYMGELGKAHRIMLNQLGLDVVNASDDAYTVTVGDDEIILRAKAPGRKLTVSWADEAVDIALERLIRFRDGIDGAMPLHNTDQAVMVAIDCLRAALGENDG